MFSVAVRMKIRHKFIVIMLLLIAIVCLGFGIAMSVSFKSYDEMLYEHASRAMNLSLSGIEHEIQKIEKLSMDMAMDSRNQEQLISIQEETAYYDQMRRMTDFKNQLFQHILTEPSISSIRFVNQQGYDFFVGQNNITNDEDQIDTIIKRAHLKKGAIVWIDPEDHTYDLIFAQEIRSIFSPILEPLGTLIFRINYEALVERHFRSTMSPETELFVLSKENILYRPNKEEFADFAIDDISYEGDHGYLLQTYNDKTYFLAHMYSTATEWNYISLIPYENIFQKRQVMRNIIFSIAIILLIVASIISYLFAKTLTRPIDLLIKQMRNVEKGDWSTVPLENHAVPRKDEIGYLHKRFQSMVRNIEQLIDENYKKQIMIKDTEYRALQAQINPHFLYNTLSSINWMARLRNDNVISTMVESLSRIFRVSIDDKRTMVTIKEELELIQGYMYIQKVRYEDRIELIVAVDEEAMEYEIPKFTIQPIVENAIHHAVDKMAEVCKISIEAKVNSSNEEVVISIKDNGPGIDGLRLEQLRSFNIQAKGTGIGLKNIHDRLQLAYGERSKFEIESAPAQGMCVRITMPLRRNTNV